MITIAGQILVLISAATMITLSIFLCVLVYVPGSTMIHEGSTFLAGKYADRAEKTTKRIAYLLPLTILGLILAHTGG